MVRQRNFFRQGELHLVVLALLRRRPRHGYDLLAELRDLFGPAYRPSAGSVYPALTALEDEGLIAPRDDGDRTTYALTAVGERALEERVEMLASVEARTGVQLSADGVEPTIARFAERVRAVAGKVDTPTIERVVEEAARRLERCAEDGGER